MTNAIGPISETLWTILTASSIWGGTDSLEVSSAEKVLNTRYDSGDDVMFVDRSKSNPKIIPDPGFREVQIGHVNCPSSAKPFADHNLNTENAHKFERYGRDPSILNI